MPLYLYGERYSGSFLAAKKRQINSSIILQKPWNAAILSDNSLETSRRRIFLIEDHSSRLKNIHFLPIMSFNKFSPGPKHKQQRRPEDLDDRDVRCNNIQVTIEVGVDSNPTPTLWFLWWQY